MLIGYMEDDCPKCAGTGYVPGVEKTNDRSYNKPVEKFIDYDVSDETELSQIGTTAEWESPISDSPKKRGRPRKEL